jgi:phosphoglycolate phosphatase-like HAD superfamily hydrolase
MKFKSIIFDCDGVLIDSEMIANRIEVEDPIKLSMIWEIGWPSEEKLKLRSSFYDADKIKAPLAVTQC